MGERSNPGLETFGGLLTYLIIGADGRLGD